MGGKDIVKAVTMMTKMPPIAAGQVVSGGQTQEETDRSMGKLMANYQDMFKVIGQAKVAPIHIEVKKGIKPVTQKQRQVPIHLMVPLMQQLDQFVTEGVKKGLPGEQKIKDNLVFHGVGQEHDARLDMLLERLRDYGITLRKDKCHVR